MGYNDEFSFVYGINVLKYVHDGIIDEATGEKGYYLAKNPPLPSSSSKKRKYEEGEEQKDNVSSTKKTKFVELPTSEPNVVHILAVVDQDKKDDESSSLPTKTLTPTIATVPLLPEEIKIPLYEECVTYEWLSVEPYEEGATDEEIDVFNNTHAQIRIMRDGYTGEVTGAAFVLSANMPDTLNFYESTRLKTFDLDYFTPKLDEHFEVLKAHALSVLAKIGVENPPIGLVMLYGRS
jgi:hypothetical protein